MCVCACLHYVIDFVYLLQGEFASATRFSFMENPFIFWDAQAFVLDYIYGFML